MSTSPFLLLALAAGACVAQSGSVDTQPQSLARPSFRLQSPLGVFQCDDEVVAIGPGYKAYLRPGAVEFVPAFGPEAPQDMSLHLHAVGMQRLGTVMARGRRWQSQCGNTRNDVKYSTQ